MTVEAWRVLRQNANYEVSDLGRIRSTRGRLLRGTITKKGYTRVILSQPGGPPRLHYLHILVAEAFNGPRPAGAETRHLDGDPSNNAASNLRFGTRQENRLDQIRHGRDVNINKTHCPSGHPYDAENTRVRPSGWRICRTCARASYGRAKEAASN